MKIIFRTSQLLMTVCLIFGCVILGLLSWTIAQFPSAKEIRGCLITKMYHVSLCPGSASYVRLSEISPALPKALVLTEDSAFWQHQGFDFEEMKRSMEKNLATGHYARGGSTLTQQLAKNLFLTEEKTLWRKAKEALITIRIEKTLSKKEILERYLNVVHWGPKIFGVKQAAQFYFHKEPRNLTVLESAYLTFLLPSPEKYSRSFFQHNLTPFAEKRVTQILENLFRYQRISEFDYVTATSNFHDFLHSGSPMAPATILDDDSSEESAEPEDD
jgi:monofunctional biosynthetic peptidoglycan transglycosylase